MAPKRNRLGLNDLPDGLLIFILSKVPLKQAIRCSILSKRWKSLWQFLPSLILSSDNFSSSSSCSSIVDGIFKLHSGNLELFEFSNYRGTFGNIREKICEWIHHAAQKDVREIRIGEYSSCLYEVPPSIFSCQSLTCLVLNNFLFTNIPDYFGGLASLATLNLYNVDLTDKTIEMILQLCPVLQILSLRDCNGLQRLKICSHCLTFLNLSSRVKAVIVNCPQLVNLIVTTKKKKLGAMDGKEMEFYLPACINLCTDITGLELFTTLKSLKKITFLKLISKSDFKILSEFPELEHMCMDIPHYSSYELPDLGLQNSLLWDYRAISEISTTFSLKNLKRFHLNMTKLFDATPLLSYILGHTPAMKTLLVSRKKGFDSIQALQFVNRLFTLQREYKEIRILLSRNTSKEERCIHCDLEKFISN